MLSLVSKTSQADSKQKNKMTTETNKWNGGFKSGTIFMLGLVIASTATINYINKKTSEKQKIETEYAQPSKLEIITKDTNNNGQHETMIKYSNNTYHLKLDSIGSPYITK